MERLVFSSAVAAGTLHYQNNNGPAESLPESEAVGENMFIIHETSVIH